MPPVFGPASPSPSALEVLRGLQRHDRGAVGEANSETSGPSRNSSTTTAAAARHAGVGERGVAVVGDDHALAGGQPVVLDDVRGAERVQRGGRPPRAWRRRAAAAVGTPAAAMTSLAKALEPSSRAAARPTGRSTAIAAARTASATPATSGASGPTTTRSAPRSAASRATAAPSSGSTGSRSATAAMPGLPGRRHGGDRGVAHQRRGQRVLAGAGPDHEYLHEGRG